MTVISPASDKNATDNDGAHGAGQEPIGKLKRLPINSIKANNRPLGADTLDKIKGTCLDKGVELDALAKLPEEERAKLIERAVAGEKVPAVKPGQPAKKNKTEVETPPKDTPSELENLVKGADGIIRLRNEPAHKVVATPKVMLALNVRAARLGLQLDQEGDVFLVRDDEGDEDHFRDIEALSAFLDLIAEMEAARKIPPRKLQPKNTPAEKPPIEPDDPQASADSDDIEIGGVEEPDKVLENVLDSIKQSKAVAEAYRKILKVSTFDHAAKKRISDEIGLLIRKRRLVQSTLAGTPEPPTGAGPAADGEPTEEDTGTEPTENVPAVAPATPPATPSPVRARLMSTYQPGTEDDPRWKTLSDDGVEARIRSAKGYGWRHPGESLRNRECRLDHIEAMQEHLEINRRAKCLVAAGKAVHVS
jgi:hypothetical protein